jgi:putative transcriptional regulator
MNKEMFDELRESVKQAGRIHRGEARPSREYVFKSQDVRAIREEPGPREKR